jgi:serine/threonine-protein kinase RsbW
VDDVEIKMALFLPRDAASVPVSRQVLDGCLETLGVTPDTRTDIALALSEACANVVQHAGPGMEYEVLATTGEGRCVIEVVNTVNRGDPSAAPADLAPDLAAEPAGAELGLPSAEPVPATRSPTTSS